MNELNPGGHGPQDTPEKLVRLTDFDLVEKLGEGKFGVVFKAKKKDSSDPPVALKKLLRSEDNACERFKREFDVVQELDHPNIVKVHEFGGDIELFFTMELSAGITLEAKTGSPQPPLVAARLINMLARAIDHAHEKNIIHRDLKPANILYFAGNNSNCPVGDSDASTVGELDPAHYRIGDFGVAKLLDNQELLTLTNAGDVLGSPAYMAPEQAAGMKDDICPATDVWALGIILFELVTGKLPFEGETPLETMTMIREQRPPEPRALNPAVPLWLQDICLACLKRNRHDRYPSAAKLAEDLDRYLKGQRPSVSPYFPVRCGRRVMGWVGQRKRSAGIGASILSALLVGMGGLLGWALIQPPPIPDPTPVPVPEPEVKYFTTFVKKWGEPVGVGPVADEKARQRTVKITRNADKVSRVEIVNGDGRRVTDPNLGAWLPAVRRAAYDYDPNTECCWEYKYLQDGSLAQEFAYDHLNRFVYRLDYYPSPDPRTVRARFSEKFGDVQLRTRSRAHFVQIARNRAGFDLELLFQSEKQQLQPDDRGSYGRRLTPDERGLPLRVENLGPDQKLALNADGYAAVKYEYEGANRKTAHFLDAQNQPIAHVKRYFGIRSKYNAAGNLEEESFLDMDGRPIWCVDRYAKRRFAYDEKTGRLQHIDYLDEHDQATLHRDGYSRCAFAYKNGRVTEVEYRDGKELARHRRGYARVRATCDDEGVITRMECFDEKGKPAVLNTGFFMISARLADHNDLFEWTRLADDRQESQ
jgi:hypothetical protein